MSQDTQLFSFRGADAFDIEQNSYAPKRPQPVVAVDVDDTVAALMPEWTRRYNEEWDDTLPLDGSAFPEWNMVPYVKQECGAKIYDILKMPDLYCDVQPIPGAREGIEALRALGLRVVFVTSCGTDPETMGASAGAKLQWLVRHGFFESSQAAAKDFYVAADKAAIRAECIIDDRVSTCRAFPGKPVLFDAPHNRRDADGLARARSWPEAVRIVKALLKLGGFYLPSGAIEIVGLAGHAGAGKSTIARELAKQGWAMPVSLANGFKPHTVAFDGLPIDEVFGERRSDEVRRVLQRRGTEEGRAVHGDDIWCRMLEVYVAYLVQHGVERVVVTDCRFHDEMDWVKAMGGVVVKLEGRGGLEGDAALHRSETELDTYTRYDMVIDNGPGRTPERVAEEIQMRARRSHPLPGWAFAANDESWIGSAR